MLDLPSDTFTPGTPRGQDVCDASKDEQYPLELVGRAKTFVSGMPVDALVDLSAEGMSVYMYCWIDSTRGSGAYVHFDPRDIADSPAVGSDSSEISPLHAGGFSLKLNLRKRDLDLLKVTACIRMKDETSGNTRNFTLGMTATQLDRLVTGEEQAFTMYDQFNKGTFTEVRLRATNAALFNGRRLRFSRSSLWNIGNDFKPVVTEVSNAIMASVAQAKVDYDDGSSGFASGLTRCVPLVPLPLLFVSLFLGTPAHSLLLLLPPRPAGSLGGPNSNQVLQRSPLSTRITRS